MVGLPAKDGLELFHVSWSIHIANRFKFLLCWLDSILSQNWSEEIHLSLLELQLFRVQADVVFASGPEHFAEGLVVL